MKKNGRTQAPLSFATGSLRKHASERVVIFFLLSLLVLLYGCASTTPPAVNGEQPRTLLSTPERSLSENLIPGLESRYISGFFRNILQMPDLEQGVEQGIPGPIVLELNHQSGKNGSVFGTGIAQGIGFYFFGFFRFPEAGSYRFQALSNDGIELVLDQRQILFDPTVHKARLSVIAVVEVAEPGWYPVTLRYFQRKGTASLKLSWQPPGTDAFFIVPQSAYGHLKEK